MGATHNNIRELLNDTRADSYRTAAEDKAQVALPGDPVEAHLVNPYMHLASTRPLQVQSLIDSGTMSKDDEEMAKWALSIYETLEGQPVRDRGRRRF